MNFTERLRPDWGTYGMLMAHMAAARSPDPYVQVGAAAFRFDHSTVSTGYNGARQGQEIDWSDRDSRRPHVRHAERNCLEHAHLGEVHFLYVTLLPCGTCLQLASDFGVKVIFYDKTYDRDQSALGRAQDLGIRLQQLSLPPYAQAAIDILMATPN